MDILFIYIIFLSYFSVAAKADKNLMSVSNLGVCFGPSLLRPAEETVAAILNIKFCNIVVEMMIENYEKIFKTEPDPLELTAAEPQQYYHTSNHRPVSFFLLQKMGKNGNEKRLRLFYFQL